jgi:SWI/SNF-related matrix-associated actin-dependent regulator of chromatin subfamily A member 5
MSARLTATSADQGRDTSPEADDSLPPSSRNLLANLMMQLRKCCLHPFLFDGAETDIDATTVEELIGASGKLAVLDQLLLRLFQTDHRCVLFSQFTSLLDIIEDYCRLRGWKYCRLDGSTTRARRNYLVERFNSKDPPSPYFIFLMSTKSGGMGLNLQSADTCILFDSDVSPVLW